MSLDPEEMTKGSEDMREDSEEVSEESSGVSELWSSMRLDSTTMHGHSDTGLEDRRLPRHVWIF